MSRSRVVANASRSGLQPIAAGDRSRREWELEGSGPTIILVHGSLQDRRVWRKVVPRLAERFSVVTYNRRGYGSGEPRGPEDVIESDVHDLLDLCASLGPDSKWLVGTSFGATVAFAALLADAQHFAGAIFHEPAVCPPDRYKRIRRVFGQGRLTEGAGLFLKRIGVELSGSQLERAQGWIPLLPAEIEAVCNWSPGVPPVRIPAALIVGDGSPAAIRWSSTKLQQMASGLRTLRLAVAGHDAVLTQPELFTDLVLTFIETSANDVRVMGRRARLDEADEP